MATRKLMQPDEIERIAGIFVELGVRKIRLTGGEPLVRKEAAEIIRRIAKFPVELTITTNGILVEQFIDVLKESGIRSLNVSLDSLNKEKFFKLTKRDNWNKVWQNIKLLLENNFHVKINVVAMKGVNDDEITDFIELTRELPLHVRFIEFMPFDGNEWNYNSVLSAEEILAEVQTRFSFSKLYDEKHATAKAYQANNHKGTFAIISTISEPFCSECNRIRLTADGKMKNCLFSKNETDLLTALRTNQDIIPLIQQCLDLKEAERGGQFVQIMEMFDASQIVNRSMISIGG